MRWIMSPLDTPKHLVIMNNYCNCFGEELKAKAPPKLRHGKSINCLSRLKGVTQFNRPNSKFTKGKKLKTMSGSSVIVRQKLCSNDQGCHPSFR